MPCYIHEINEAVSISPLFLSFFQKLNGKNIYQLSQPTFKVLVRKYAMKSRVVQTAAKQAGEELGASLG